MVRSCMGCVPPKRHPGCHGQCKEYLEQKAEYDRLKAIDYQKRHTIGMLVDQRAEAINRANKKRRH